MNRTLISAAVAAGLAALYFGSWELSLVSSFLRCVFLVFTVIFYIILSELWITILIVGCLGTLSIQMIFKSRQKFMAETKKIEEQARKEAEQRGEDGYIGANSVAPVI